jgi:predicted XRE-type DNA-binding protein
MKAQTFANVFDAISDTPEEAANLKARAKVMALIRGEVESWGIPQEQAAARLDLTRPRMNDLLRGKISKFSLDALFNAASAAGVVLQIDSRKQAANKTNTRKNRLGPIRTPSAPVGRRRKSA